MSHEAHEFDTALTKLLPKPTAPNALVWPSDNDDNGQLKIVVLPDYQVFSWVPETLNSQKKEHQREFLRPDDELGALIDNGSDDPRFAELELLFADNLSNSRVFYRPTKEQSVYDLYLLVRFSDVWVGATCKIVNS